MRRVSVIGNTGSGKTTVARALAALLSAPYIELDALHWGTGWTEASGDELIARVAPLIAGDSWVADGMYWRKIGGSVLQRADTVIWLDPPWIVTFLRLVRRTITRGLRGTELWNGNRESLRQAFFSRESILLWSLRTRPRRRQLFEAWLARPEFAHLTVKRFGSASSAIAWADEQIRRQGA